MRSLGFGLLLLATAAFSQDAIPAGTILPVQLNSSMNSRKSHGGQMISARVMQDVPLAPHRTIRAGATVAGRVLKVVPMKDGNLAAITFQFDTLKVNGRALPITTNLRALASMMEVEDAQVPTTATDRGTTWAWVTRNLIGGEVAYGAGGPVARGDEIVGQALFGGVLSPLRSRPGSRCMGDIRDDTHPQALWVFSSDACGVYSFDGVDILHAGRTAPLGQVTLSSRYGNFNIRSGSGMLLQITDANP